LNNGKESLLHWDVFENFDFMSSQILFCGDTHSKHQHVIDAVQLVAGFSNARIGEGVRSFV